MLMSLDLGIYNFPHLYNIPGFLFAGCFLDLDVFSFSGLPIKNGKEAIISAKILCIAYMNLLNV